MLHIQLFPEFGTFCADGEKAAAFRYARIDPFVQLHEKIVLDFQGVRNMNSSFTNALVANLISQNAPEILPKLQFANCNATVRVAVEAAIALGLQRLKERQAGRSAVTA
jgi:hypothetical protein